MLAQAEPSKTTSIDELCTLARKAALFAAMLEQLGYEVAVREIDDAMGTWPLLDFELPHGQLQFLEPGERVEYVYEPSLPNAMLVHRVICERARLHVYRVRGWEYRSDRQAQGINWTPPLFEVLRPGETLEFVVENATKERIELANNVRVEGYVLERAGGWS